MQRLIGDGSFVNVLVRDASRFDYTHPNVNVIEGDVLDYAEVDKCVAGTQLVYVCIGTWGNKDTQVYSMGTENIVMAMKKHGVTWNEETLDRFIENPLKTVPGTKMGYAGVKDPQERADLIAYLKQASSDPKTCE